MHGADDGFRQYAEEEKILCREAGADDAEGGLDGGPDYEGVVLCYS